MLNVKFTLTYLEFLKSGFLIIALKFDTVGPSTRLLDIIDRFCGMFIICIFDEF